MGDEFKALLFRDVGDSLTRAGEVHASERDSAKMKYSVYHAPLFTA